MTMPRRTSIHIDGFSHKNPIPAASRIGNFVFSGSILGVETGTGRFGATLAEQCAFMFANLRRTVAAAGGTPDDIIKLTVWMRDRTQRAAVNHEWLAMFPDPASRPARHTMQSDLDGEKLIECEFVAILE